MNNKSFFTKIKCAIRKLISAKVTPYMIFNSWRIFFYRLCGYRIGSNVFIGMRCYLDDLEPQMITIGNNVTISYGVFFACHGRHQDHYPITINDGAYIGMRSSIISKNVDKSTMGVIIGKNAIVGACTLVNRDIPDGATAVGVPCRIIEKKPGANNGQ